MVDLTQALQDAAIATTRWQHASNLVQATKIQADKVHIEIKKRAEQKQRLRSRLACLESEAEEIITRDEEAEAPPETTIPKLSDLTIQQHAVRTLLERATAKLDEAQARESEVSQRLKAATAELQAANAAFAAARLAAEHAAIEHDQHTPAANKPALHAMADRRAGIAT